MKLKVQNLGRIKEGEIDVRPLTIIVGRNNTNKTWLAYSLYSLLRDFARLRPPIHSEALPETSVDSLLLDEARRIVTVLNLGRQETVSTNAQRSDLTLRMPTHIDVWRYANGLAPFVSRTHLDREARATLSLTLGELSPSSLDTMSVSLTKGKTSFECSLAKNGHTMISTGILVSERDPVARFSEFLKFMVFSTFETSAVFPSDRNGLFAFSQSLRSDDSITRQSTTIPNLDFINLIRDVVVFSNEDQWKPLVKRFESDILQGTVRFVGPNEAKSFQYTPHSGPPLQAHAAASLVRGLSALVLYLRSGYARQGSVIVIDEPEMNAHPEAQLVIAELLAMMVNSGLRIILTTHSPFFVEHINNLVEAYGLEKDGRKVIQSKFKLKSSDAFLDPDDVSVYEMKEQDGHVIPTDIFNREECLIRLQSFGDESDYVSNLFSDIYEMAHPKENEETE